MQPRVATDIEKSWTIRRAGDSDVEAMAAMRSRLDEHLARSNPRMVTLSSRGRDALAERYREKMADPSLCTLVAEDRPSRLLIGMALGRASVREALVPSGISRIDDVWVAPGFRRHGICRALVKELLIFFEQIGAEIVDVTYTIGNAEAEHTWHDLGFQPVLTVGSAKLEDIIRRLEPESS